MVENDVPQRRKRPVARILVPAGIVAVVAAGIGLPALAEDRGPNLPQITAQQLIAKTLGSGDQAFSGTLEVNADLGVPPTLLSAATQAAQGVGAKAGAGASAGPQAKLTELLGGRHELDVASDGPERQRLELDDYQLVHNGDQVWAYDGANKQALHLTGRQGAERHELPVTPQEAAQRFLTGTASTTDVSVDGTGTVAGRSVYQLMVKPKQSGSTLRDIRISVDSQTGVPLALLVQAADGSRVLDAHFSSVSFAKPDAKSFTFTLPQGAKLTEAPAGHEGAKPGKAEGGRPGAETGRPGAEAGRKPQFNVTGEGWTTVFASQAPGGENAQHADAKGLSKLVGKQVKGGSLISTKVVNVLLTDDGRVYAGAVTLPLLQQAAGIK